MRSPSIVIVDVVTDRPLQVLVAEYQPVIKTFVTDAAYPSFCDRISLRRFYRCTDLLDSERFDASIECDAETAVTVVDQEFGRFY